LLADPEQIVWRRVEDAGKRCKEVTWKRFERAHNKTSVPGSETRELLRRCKVKQGGHDMIGNTESQQVYSRSVMLSVHCRLALRTRATNTDAENKYISLKSTSEIQFVCPSMAPTCKSATRNIKKASKKLRQLPSMPLAVPSFQGDSDLCAQLAASSTETVLTWLTEAPISDKKAKTSLCDVEKPNLDLSLEESSSQLAGKLAKLLLRTPGAPSKVLRDDAPEFVPCLALTAANELRAEAPVFVPYSMPEVCGSSENCTLDDQLETDAHEYSSKDSSLEVSSTSD
jgi:hypothetical protein